LQDTWNSAQGSPEQLMNQLEEWCIQAENSGILVLRDFSARLRRYTLAASGSGI
jgi:stearoyl-CoA desaturase (delta-9 desaturase)